MTDQQILEKAIQKAIDGGWTTSFSATIKSVDYRQGKLERNMVITVHVKDGDISIMYNLESIIYSHDFAKALWGIERKESREHGFGTMPRWKYHLLQMVIANDPIKYLGDNI